MLAVENYLLPLRKKLKPHGIQVHLNVNAQLLKDKNGTYTHMADTIFFNVLIKLKNGKTLKCPFVFNGMDEKSCPNITARVIRDLFEFLGKEALKYNQYSADQMENSELNNKGPYAPSEHTNSKGKDLWPNFNLESKEEKGAQFSDKEASRYNQYPGNEAENSEAKNEVNRSLFEKIGLWSNFNLEPKAKNNIQQLDELDDHAESPDVRVKRRLFENTDSNKLGLGPFSNLEAEAKGENNIQDKSYR
jgi:hypothetical protein